jgi:hypothetical protein
VLVSVVAIACVSAIPSTAAIPSGTENVVTVETESGKPAELLRRLPIPQLAVALHLTPAQLRLQAEPLGSVVALELGGLLSNPNATVQEALNLLAAHGVSTAPIEQLIARLLADVTGNGEQLSVTIDEVLADLREDRQIALARELVLPAAVLEAAQLVPSTLERIASSLSTTTSNLVATLRGAGATSNTSEAPSVAAASPGGASETPFAASVVPGRTTTVIVGAPTASGGLSLTTLSATPAARAAAAAPPVSNAFTIVRITVTSAGVVRETVRLPGPGRLAINASTRRRVAFRSRKGHRRTVTRTAKLASVSKTLSSGVNTLTIRLRGSAARVRPLVVELSTTYTPIGGSPNTVRRTVTVRRGVKKHRHR